MSSVRSTPAWLVRANKIRRDLANAKFGDKGEIFSRYAEDFGFAVSSLKKEVTAADFVAKMDEEIPDFAEDLRRLGYAAVVELGRLYREDPKSAISRAREAAAGELAAKEIKNSRFATKFSGAWTKRRKLLEEFISYLDTHRDELGIVQGAPAIFPGASAAYVLHDGRTACAAFQLVTDNPGVEDRLARYLALLAFYDLVLLGIDGNELPWDWHHWLRLLRHSPDRFRVFGITDMSVQRIDYSKSTLNEELETE